MDEHLKLKASILAKKLWTNISSVISMYLKNDSLENKWISFYLRIKNDLKKDK